MIRKIQRGWKEFLKNADLYMMLLIAAPLTFYGMVNGIIGLSPELIVQSGLLAILAVLPYSLLKHRRTDKTIEATLGQLTKSFSPKLQIYKRQEDAYKFLVKYIKHLHVKKAVFIQYSCISAKPVLQAVLSRGATALVYIQHEKAAVAIGAYEQQERIMHCYKSLPGELAGLFNAERITIRKYHTPGSVNGIKLDFGTEQILCMGWYTYEATDESNRNPAYPTDTVQISGHDVAAVVVWSGTKEFEALNETFSMLEKNYQTNAEAIPLKW